VPGVRLREVADGAIGIVTDWFSATRSALASRITEGMKPVNSRLTSFKEAYVD